MERRVFDAAVEGADILSHLVEAALTDLLESAKMISGQIEARKYNRNQLVQHREWRRRVQRSQRTEEVRFFLSEAARAYRAVLAGVFISDCRELPLSVSSSSLPSTPLQSSPLLSYSLYIQNGCRRPLLPPPRFSHALPESPPRLQLQGFAGYGFPAGKCAVLLAEPIVYVCAWFPVGLAWRMQLSARDSY